MVPGFIKKTTGYLLNVLKNLVGNETFEILMHAKNYISAEFFIKALSFLAIPVFTRLLLPADYGLIAIYSSVISIFTVFLGLNMHQASIRYYHDNRTGFAGFYGACAMFIAVFNVCAVCLLYLGRDVFSRFFKISPSLFMMGVYVAIMTAVMNYYMSYLNTSKQSRKYSVIAILKSSIMLLLAIAFMLILKQDRYLGRPYAEILVFTLFAVYFIYQIAGTALFRWDWGSIRRALLYSMPLIPHTLSNYILADFDRVIINQLKGESATGLYAFAYNVGMIMNVIVSGYLRAWNPAFFEKMNKKQFAEIAGLLKKFSDYIYFLGIALLLFAQEIIMLMADKKYYEALPLVPLIVTGYVFVFLYSCYANYSFYYKKTGLIAVNTFIAGFTSIGLNYLLIPRFGYSVAAFNTMLSYAVLFLLHYLNVKHVLKVKGAVSVRILFPRITYVFMALVLFYVVEWYVHPYPLKLLIRLAYIALAGWIFWGGKLMEKARGKMS